MYKICFITTIPGTIRTFILGFAEYIYKTQNADVTFICKEDAEFRDMIPGYFHYIPLRMERGVHISGIQVVRELIKIFKKEKYDLIQYSTPNAAVYASIAGALSHVPVRLYCQWGIAYVGFSGVKRVIFKAIERMVCRLSTWVEPDSFGNLNFSHSEKLYPESKGSVVWNGSASGVSLEKFDISKKNEYRREMRIKYQIPEDAMVFGFVGRITGDKGINELFAAFKEVEQKVQNEIYLMLIGPEEKADSLREDLYQYAQNNKRIIMCGKTHVVEQYLSAIDCYILPSYREGFGLAVVEAEAMGIPVIVTDIPGPTDAMIQGKTGLLVKKKDVKSLVDAMLRMMGQPELREEFGYAGYIYAKEHFEQKTLFRLIAEDRLKLIEESKR